MVLGRVGTEFKAFLAGPDPNKFGGDASWPGLEANQIEADENMIAADAWKPGPGEISLKAIKISPVATQKGSAPA